MSSMGKSADINWIFFILKEWKTHIIYGFGGGGLKGRAEDLEPEVVWGEGGGEFDEWRDCFQQYSLDSELKLNVLLDKERKTA